MPKCPYCKVDMILGDGCYWCMNKRCAEQFYPSGNDELHKKEESIVATNIEEMAREINELRDVLGRLRDWIERGVPVVEQEGLYKLVRITLGGE